jgi:hypothetical protein
MTIQFNGQALHRRSVGCKPDSFKSFPQEESLPIANNMRLPQNDARIRPLTPDDCSPEIP